MMQLFVLSSILHPSNAISVLPGAHDVIINGGQIIAQNYNQSGIDILYEASTPEASVDAEERVGDYALSCYEGTHVQYIKDITTWATANNEHDSIPPLYWMKGPAAVGKSAMAQTCAERLQASGHLAAAFFFSVNGRRKDHTRFFPTLAHQLLTTLPDYCDIVNHKVSVDRSLVKKTMSSQFRSLIVEPLQELRELGKDMQRRAIFIDGLDECQSTSAQMEIIKIITSSIQAGSTPFCWAVFSREEPHIISTFASFTKTTCCHSVLLPISCKADGEIELYLCGGFENILRRRNLLHLSSSWPTAKQIQMFVDAAVEYQEYPPPTFDETINLKHSFFDHNLSPTSKSSLLRTLSGVHGTLAFHHKSFYDFLHNPACSSSFCVTTLAMHQNLFDRLIQQHHHYALSFVIQGTKLVSRPGMTSSSASLSWPQGTFRTFMYDLPPSSLQKLAELDYRKFLFASIVVDGIGVFSGRRIFCLGGAGVDSVNEHTEFSRLKDYREFDRDTFLAMVDKLETSILHTISRQNQSSTKSGLYKLGHRDKSVIWFWEFDTEEQYFHQFRTVNYEEAMAFYKVEKFTLWDGDEDEDSSGAEDEDSSSVGDEGGSIVEERGEPGHAHGDESGHEANEEQKKEKIDNDDGQKDTEIPSGMDSSAEPTS
ncbi:hypothetical protein D9756_004479 [Leucocoprinus leucothites]|uniref:Nephrocystin 3-like N-terminal domain-containing protein n=1 Tax=Leucocoprinus leucothites TaxID=201217 RepID=A0A8H5LKN0_9AGAR|nr:hypothetical protein D9756_004479 [Leucoagaricus leucothites]